MFIVLLENFPVIIRLYLYRYNNLLTYKLLLDRVSQTLVVTMMSSFKYLLKSH